jgi:hypothetical protein
MATAGESCTIRTEAIPGSLLKGGTMMTAFIRFCIACTVVFIASSAGAQHLYLSDAPNLCALVGTTTPDRFYIYAHSPGDANFEQASFRLNTMAFDASQVESVNPMIGGAILSGDIFSGITVQWIPHELEHWPILEINLIGPAFPGGEVWVTDAEMIPFSGPPVPVEDKRSIICDDFHCSICFYQVDVPDTANAIVGGVTTIPILLGAGCDGALAAVFDVTDSEGWVDSYDPTGLIYPGYCGACFYDKKPVDITVSIPAGTPAGTLSEVLVADTGTFIIRAIEKVPVEDMTWGRMKAIHADK